MSADTITTPDDAKKAIVAVPPQLVDAVRTDPELLAQLSRAQLMLVQDKLTRDYLKNVEAPVSQGVAVADVIRKTANLEPKQGTGPGAGNGFSITINLPAVGQAQATTIEAKGTPLALGAEDAETVNG